MRTLEKILTVGLLVAVIMKLNLISGGDFVMLLCALTLAVLYYPLGFLTLNGIRLRHVFKKEAYKDVSSVKIVLAIIAGIGLSGICVGSLYKVLSFVNADVMLNVGLGMTVVALAISLVTFVKHRDQTSKAVILRATIATVVGMILVWTTELSIVKFLYRDHPAYIEAYTKYLANPTDEALIKQKEREFHKINLSKEEFEEYERSMMDQ